MIDTVSVHTFSKGVGNDCHNGSHHVGILTINLKGLIPRN
jgi:hypothetical protein